MEEHPLSSNNSTEAGWLTPVSDDPTDGEALDRLLSRWVCEVSGLQKGRVRPRWQPSQKALLPADTDWCAAGVIQVIPDDNPAFVQTSEERSELWRHETIECMVSFYGPSGMAIACRFRDGLCLPQNNAALNLSGLSLKSFSQITPFPELINQQWIRRYDLTVSLCRKVVREYDIRTLKPDEAGSYVKFFGG
ncbi:hypothetical protein KY843_001649 [Escherichia coli]|uniref:phage neck terminator protein n=1 Tax=Escherichia sp. 20412-1 TaxID=2137853 RepID=UPI000D160E4F|nr:hypothetical protein [Escherichia sp. 20412-1]EHU4694741.1 hypothetical protein [Escherichia coli]PSY61255.1 hypothetical protein C7B16_21350 [Escherichia sp. 20412-1]